MLCLTYPTLIPRVSFGMIPLEWNCDVGVCTE